MAEAARRIERGGLRAEILPFGARLAALEAPDRQGRLRPVVLGLRTAEEFARAGGHFGATAGRFANRIAGGRFALDGRVFELARNAGGDTLHGGPHGFGHRDWAVEAADATSVRLSLLSPDGDGGFPGTLRAEVTYALEEDGALRIDAVAETDRPTVVNLANHAYFNLEGEGTGDVLGHRILIEADAFTPTDAAQIPTGEIRPVEGTAFDLRRPTAVSDRIRRPDPQLLLARGFDHNFVLRPGGGLRRAAVVEAPGSGIRLEVLTTAPGLQFYTGNNLDGSVVGRGGAAYRQGDGLCLEAQGFPDAPNHPNFPSAALRPGERYHAATVYRFGTAGPA